MKIRCECAYCAHQFIEHVYDSSGIESVRCPECDSRHPKVFKDEDRDKFGYDKC